MDLDFAIIADGVTARPDNKLDIYGAGFDTIYTTSVPARHTQLTVAIRVLLSQRELESPHTLEIVLQGADGQEIARATGQVEAMSDDLRAQVPAGRQVGIAAVLHFPGLIFPEYGNYQMAILWDGNEPRPPLFLTVAELPQASE